MITLNPQRHVNPAIAMDAMKMLAVLVVIESRLIVGAAAAAVTARKAPLRCVYTFTAYVSTTESARMKLQLVCIDRWKLTIHQIDRVSVWFFVVVDHKACPNWFCTRYRGGRDLQRIAISAPAWLAAIDNVAAAGKTGMIECATGVGIAKQIYSEWTAFIYIEFGSHMFYLEMIRRIKFHINLLKTMGKTQFVDRIEYKFLWEKRQRGRMWRDVRY